MKFILLSFIIIFCKSYKPMKHEPYTKTGHEQFEVLEAKHPYKLLIDINEDYKQEKLKSLKKRAFGTSESYFYKYFDATYESTVIFSRSNKTREEYVFAYDLETVNYNSVSVSVEGSINAKKVFKNVKGDITLDGDLSLSYTTESYVKNTEQGKMSIKIYPNKKVTLRLVGDAVVSNGVSKYYFFGICMKKGTFEIVEVQSVIYELKEEDA